jgi:hypothetical protein
MNVQSSARSRAKTAADATTIASAAEDTMPTLHLIRGLPGSGKTTLAKRLMYDAECAGRTVGHFEADQHFMVPCTGQGLVGVREYVFDASKLQEAHALCLQRTRESLTLDQDAIVANCFIQYRDARPYFELAEELKCQMLVTTCWNNWGSVHNVPPEVLAKMARNWERF